MNTKRCFIVGQVAWLLVFGSLFYAKLPSRVKDGPPEQPPALVSPSVPLTVPPLPELPPPSTDPELVNVQVPIPKEMRVYNKSGSQCVWCTIQMLANYNHIPKAQDLTLTHKNATGPAEVKRVLESRGVRFKQTIKKDEDMLEEYVMKKKLGVGVGINHGTHMILVCHFDRQAGVVKIIDNADRKLRIQTWTLAQFRSKWSEWVLVVFPDGYTDTTGTVTPVQGNPEWAAWWDGKR